MIEIPSNMDHRSLKFFALSGFGLPTVFALISTALCGYLLFIDFILLLIALL
jgi:hypothetical protein